MEKRFFRAKEGHKKIAGGTPTNRKVLFSGIKCVQVFIGPWKGKGMGDTGKGGRNSTGGSFSSGKGQRERNTKS